MMGLYIQYGMKPGESGGLQLTCSPQREAALFMGGMQYDPWPDLAGITCPVLILEGEVSENRHFIDLPKAASLLPQGSHKTIPGAGHLLPMEKPQEVVRIIKTFFDSLSD
jgi:pimeloyl-ACP methyl ester carboxylesterase